MARQFDPVADFGRFNLIIVMDDYIFSELEALAMTNDEKAKLRKMTDYCRKFGYTQVPDPFYGGEDGFELVLDLLEDACHGLYEEIIGNMA
jgi:protein-tyrosine phosphatase